MTLFAIDLLILGVEDLDTGECLALWVIMWRSRIGVLVARTSHIASAAPAEVEDDGDDLGTLSSEEIDIFEAALGLPPAGPLVTSVW